MTVKYSEEKTQSWKKFPEPDWWLNGFLGATLDNCEWCLKPSGTLAINIADVKDYEKLSGRKFTDDFVALAESKGWRVVERLQLELSAAPGKTEFRRFDNAVRQVLSVSKEDLLKREAQEKRKKERKQKGK